MNKRERMEYIMIHYAFLGVNKEGLEMSPILGCLRFHGEKNKKYK